MHRTDHQSGSMLERFPRLPDTWRYDKINAGGVCSKESWIHWDAMSDLARNRPDRGDGPVTSRKKWVAYVGGLPQLIYAQIAHGHIGIRASGSSNYNVAGPILPPSPRALAVGQSNILRNSATNAESIYSSMRTMRPFSTCAMTATGIPIRLPSRLVASRTCCWTKP